jgi:hypothetical protein
MNEPLEQVLDVKTAINEFKELLRDISCIPKINKFIKEGKSAFVINKFDDSRAKLTGKIFVTYQLADALKVLLGAVRAKNIDP